MSIVDISKSVDDLAKAINQKNTEVDELKRLYNHKLSIINQYVELLTIDSDDIDKEISEMKLMETLEESVKCKNCNHEISLLDADSDFVLIPKKKIRNLKIDKSSCSKKADSSSTAGPSSHNIIPKNTAYDKENSDKKSMNNTHYRNKSKKTCSYCKKAGHTRAKCLVRLNNNG